MIFSGQDNEETMFDTLVPKFYSELYVLYNILNGADVLHDCEFSEPSVSEDTLQISIDMSKSSRIAANKYFEDTEDILIPFRNSDPVKCSLDKTLHGLSITFN